MDFLYKFFCVFSSRASAAVNNLKRFHEKKKKGLKPHSLYLDHIIRKSVSSHNRRESHSRGQRDIYVIKVDTNKLFFFGVAFCSLSVFCCKINVCCCFFRTQKKH